MTLREIMGILIASMLVFLPFAVLFNPVLLKKHKDNKDKKEDISENSTSQQNENYENDQTYSVEKFTNIENENK